MAEGKAPRIKISCFIHALEHFLAVVKDRKINIPRDEYDMIQDALKYARGYQKLGTAALSIFVLGVLAVVATLVIKYGYDYALGVEIARYTTPGAVVAGGTALWLLVEGLKKYLAAADVAHKFYRKDRLQMFR